ncbi:MAG: hypothetical protein ACKVOK_01335 [Flavobacteriales bacterium]
MKKKKEIGLDFEVDKLTNSIENARTGDSFPTEVSILNEQDLVKIRIKSDWQFDWLSEYRSPQKEVFKLTIIHNPRIIQGLISLEDKRDHVFMHLVESAAFNKGKEKVYIGVPGNLVAFACKRSFQMGHDGNVAFISKTKLIEHYIVSLGAKHVGGRLMVLDGNSALRLINKYFPNE